MKVHRITDNREGEWAGSLVEFTRSGPVREFEYHGYGFDATVSAMETGDNADTMRIQLRTTGQECSGELTIEGCWERSEFFAFMRNLANALNELPRKQGPEEKF